MNHCAHGGAITVQQVIDWRPFTTYTTRDESPDQGFVLNVTTVFTAVPEGTEVTSSVICEPEDMWPQIAEILFPTLERSGERLAKLLAARAGTA